MPAPIATGAKRLPCSAPPSTSGSKGNTQGDSVVNPPAARLSPSCGSESAIDMPGDDQSADFRAIMMFNEDVSPTSEQVSS